MTAAAANATDASVAPPAADASPAAADSPVAPPAGLDDFTLDVEGVTDGEPLAPAVAADASAAKADAAEPSAAKDDVAAAVAGDESPNDDAAKAESGDVDAEAEAMEEEGVAAKSNDGAAADAAMEEDAASSDDAAGSTETDSDADADAAEEQPELWDLKLVLKASQIAQPNPTMCATDGCGLVACCVWASNLAPEEPWYSCLDCQENDFGGWPEKASDVPLKTVPDDLREAMVDKCTRLTAPAMPDLPASLAPAAPAPAEEAATPKEDDAVEEEEATTEEDKASADESSEGNGASSGSEDDDGEEMWELKKVMGTKDLSKAKPTMCMTDECGLVACSKWVSTHDKENPWYSCLDCQENDYGGWPEAESGELPIKHLDEENAEAIADKCSNQDAPAMPNLPTSLPLLETAAGEKKGGAAALAVTPIPNAAVADGQSQIVVGMAGAGKGGKKKALKGGVTPSPMPPKGASKKAAAKGASKGDGKKAAADKAKPAPLNKKTLEMHAKWQAEAEKLGGPGAKIVVSKPDAKKIIFDALHDSFKPMNINGLYLKLKAVVPSVILRSCLDDMVDKDLSNPFADDSDDEDGGKASKKGGKKSGGGAGGDEYAGSLRVKEGRNVNNTLYYVDHTKQSNNGDGLLPEKRNELLSDLQGAKAEVEQLTMTSKQTNAEAAKFESEPKNEELLNEVDQLEKDMKKMEEEVEEARGHAGNEKHVKLVKKEIDSKGAVWRKRKRQCIEFISMMEESTEGTITLKKCLKGDGPIDIDSDEAAIQGAIAFASRKKARMSSMGGRKSLGGAKGSSGGASGGLSADPNFVGVKLTAQGKPERVFLPGSEE